MIEPSPALLPFVDGYLHVRDLAGDHRGRPIRTAPRPGGVLTVNLGQPNRTADGAATPRLSLLGIQTCARSWRSDANTHFVMALLTPAGLVRFASGSGADTADTLLDLRSVIGERTAHGLVDTVHARLDGLVAAFDAWLLARLCGERERPEMHTARAACMVLSRATRVDVAADQLGVSRRHLSRIVSRHLGISSKALIDLYRLDRSLRALQRGQSNGAAGFADQAHQVREWRRRLATTPGRYAREGRSALADAFGAAADRPAFYL
ncbi:MAG TPA: helix-turn-helix domain-containing protein [Kofleriaceae bacterium]